MTFYLLLSSYISLKIKSLAPSSSIYFIQKINDTNTFGICLFLFLLIQEPSPQVIFLSVILIKEYGLLFAYLFVF